MEIVYTWIKNIIIYIIMLNVIMNLLGKSSYKKYIGVFTGMILVILVVSPIIKYIKAASTFDYNFEEKSFVYNAKDISNEMADMEGKQQETIYKEYKEKIKNQIIQLIEKQDLNPVKVEVEINEEKDSSDFGKINQITVVANHKDNQNKRDISVDTEIEKITIDKIDIEDKNENKDKSNNSITGANGALSAEESMLKNSLADFYNISLDNINISIQE